LFASGADWSRFRIDPWSAAERRVVRNADLLKRRVAKHSASSGPDGRGARRRAETARPGFLTWEAISMHRVWCAWQSTQGADRRRHRLDETSKASIIPRPIGSIRNPIGCVVPSLQPACDPSLVGSNTAIRSNVVAPMDVRAGSPPEPLVHDAADSVGRGLIGRPRGNGTRRSGLAAACATRVLQCRGQPEADRNRSRITSLRCPRNVVMMMECCSSIAKAHRFTSSRYPLRST
jgi:hypothetical protein